MRKINSKLLMVVAVIAIIMTGCEGKLNSGNSNSGGSSVDVNERLYKRAVEIEDYRTAIVALNYILLEDSSNWEYKDSLARTYLRNGAFTPGIKLGEQVMDKDPKNYKLLELIAAAYEYQGDLTSAYRNFNKLHKELDDIRYAYILAKIGFQQGNYQMGVKRLDEVLADSSTALVEFPTVDGGQQQVDIHAGAYFLLAQVEIDKGNVQGAGNYISKALKISPNFQSALYAQQQLAGMKEQQSAYQQQMKQQQQKQAEYNRMAEEERRKAEEYRKQQQK